jgi:transcriptional regulator with XRE-family HTH domain
MDGKWKLAEVLREVRQLRGLTQRELAQLARVPQPSIASIESTSREPSLTLLSGIVESAGFAIRIELVPLSRFSAVNTARQIFEVVNSDHENPRNEDSALRVLLSFRDHIRHANNRELRELIDEPPDLSGSRHWDSFLAAVVEEESARRNFPTPHWVNDKARFLKPFWFLSTNERLHEWEFDTAPAAFVRHGIFVAAEELASI